MKKPLLLFMLIGWPALAQLKISQFPNTAAPGGSYLFVFGVTNVVPNTNYNMTFDQFTYLVTNTFGLASTSYVATATNGFVTSSITNGLATTNYVNTATNGLVTSSITNGLATTNYVVSATNSLASTNYVNTTSSNRVTVAAGSNTTITTNSSAGVITYTVAANTTFSGGVAFDNIIVTNGVNHIRSQVTSTATTNQINVATGPQYYYWTNMVTNVVLQLTNLFSMGVTNRTLDFFFAGATNNGPNYTVSFLCPNPAGVNIRWGVNSPTNGSTDITVTNNTRAGASITIWETNLVEAYFSGVR